MTVQPTEPRPAPRIDPNSDRGREATRKAAVIAAGVITRLRREGIPIPPPKTP
jgi:hypothetical protein